MNHRKDFGPRCTVLALFGIVAAAMLCASLAGAQQNLIETVQVTQQGARPDVRVRVRIGGTRLSPTLELSTPDSSRVTTADLISYLTTGGPSNEISGRGADYTATRALLTSVGSYLGGKVS